jgi:hypothetical protein
MGGRGVAEWRPRCAERKMPLWSGGIIGCACDRSREGSSTLVRRASGGAVEQRETVAQEMLLAGERTTLLRRRFDAHRSGRAASEPPSWWPIRPVSPTPCASRRSGWWSATTPSPMTTEGCNCPPARRAPATSRRASRCANSPTAPCRVPRPATDCALHRGGAQIAAVPTVTPYSPPSRTVPPGYS